jgi:taurine dioxygenase
METVWQEKQLSPHLGTAIYGVDLRTHRTPAFAQQLKQLLARRGVVVLKDQQLQPQDQLDFTRLLGQPILNFAHEFTWPRMPEIAILSNILVDGKPIGNRTVGRNWHTDFTFKECPAAYTMLYGIEVPDEGGGTGFARLQKAYEELSAEEQAMLRGRSATYSYAKLQERIRAGRPATAAVAEPDVSHPLIRVHPETGEEHLFINHNDLLRIDGFSEDESLAFAEKILESACSDDAVFEHRWERKDLVIWDNRIVLHIGLPYDMENERRLLHRTMVQGERPLAAA